MNQAREMISIKGLKKRKPLQMNKQKKPYPFQLEAIKAILQVFKTHDRAHIVMACGTGKSLVALWTAEQLKAQRIVVFIPSLALISQLLHEWLSLTSWSKVSCLAVCSDETVTRGTDTIVVNKEECDFPVTMDVKIIRAFLKKQPEGVRIVFCTYHSSNVLAESIKGSKFFELGIFDEAHKTTGNNHFGLALEDKIVPIKKRLFMTATPKHCDVNKDEVDYRKVLYSMDSEKDYGPRAYTFSFRKAISSGIITDYKVLISIIPSREEQDKAQSLEGKIAAINKALEKYSQLAKVITFHRTIKEAFRFSRHLKEKETSSYASLHVSSFMPSYQRKELLRWFEKTKKAIITNARCLTEGIDLPAVDMVAFMDAKHSKIDIVQAIGRTMRKAPGKIHGHILLPLALAQQPGESLEEAIARADFQDIWEVMQALSEQDEALQQTINCLRQKEDRDSKSISGLDRYVEILSHDNFNIKLKKQLNKMISIKIIDRFGNKWDEMYGRLLKFKSQYEHVNVSKNFKQDKMLAIWVQTQRKFYKQNKLNEERVKLLKDIGFQWNIYNQWYKMYNRLLSFKNKYSHCNVPQSCSKDKSLSAWVNRQRMAYRQKHIEEKKVKLLENIGFQWEVHDARWNEMYGRLLKFKLQHSHCNVPQRYKKDRSLSTWVGTQRANYKNGKTNKNKIALLEDIGFEWDISGFAWQRNFHKLKQFRQQHGHVNVPVNFKQDKMLAIWVRTQRKRYKRKTITKNEFNCLESIGFQWDRRNAQWNEIYLQLLKFKEKYGHCDVPKIFENQSLSAWVRTQRAAYKKQKLDKNKIALLENISFQWIQINSDTL